MTLDTGSCCPVHSANIPVYAEKNDRARPVRPRQTMRSFQACQSRRLSAVCSTLSLVLVLALVHAGRAQVLLDCLRATGSSVTTPSDPEFAAAKLVANRRFSSTPAVITYPNNTEAVQSILKCARASNASISVRSGGHSYEGESYFTEARGTCK